MPLINLQQNMYSPITLGFHLFYYLIGMTDILFITPNQILYMSISCVNCLTRSNRSYALKSANLPTGQFYKIPFLSARH